MPLESCKDLVSSFRNDILTRRVDKNLSINIALARVEKFVKIIKLPRPLITVNIEGAHIMYYTLTYDYRYVINIE